MKKHIGCLAGVGVTLALALPAVAVEVEVYTVPDPIQDDWLITGRTHELVVGLPPSHQNELISSATVPWGGHIPCPAEFISSAVQVQIVNLTGLSWPSLYYVADPETTLSNWDELVGQVGYNPWLAFKIDAIGENTPLVSESLTADGVFEPNETWEFVIQDYSNALGGPPHALDSYDAVNNVGQIAWASAGWPPSTGSIIPEPTSAASVMLLGAFGAVLWARRRTS